MAVPNTFEPGTVASSGEVNENFQDIDDRIGPNSTASVLEPPGTIVLGPRTNAQLSGESDTSAGGNTAWFQVGWNVEQYASGATYKQRRYHSGEPAVLTRWGDAGFQVYTTVRTSGDLNAQLNKVFEIGLTTYIYVPTSRHFTRSQASPSDLDDYRLTYTPIEPVAVYAGTSIGAHNGITRSATSYGIPSDAVGIKLAWDGTAGGSDAKVEFTQARSGTRHRKHGFVCGVAAGKYDGKQGDVMLGTSGDYRDKFVEYRSGSFTNASLYIQGYYL